MAHPFGCCLDLPHGLCNAILLDGAVAYNFPYATTRYGTIMERMGLTCKARTSDTLVKALIDLKASLGITSRLGALGVREKDIEALSVMSLKDACIVTNPKLPIQAEVEELYANAL